MPPQTFTAAESEGIEPPRLLRSTAFKTAAIANWLDSPFKFQRTEAAGFEPARLLRPTVFETVAINRTRPHFLKRATGEIRTHEITALQAAPLSHSGTVADSCVVKDSNLRCLPQGFLLYRQMPSPLGQPRNKAEGAWIEHASPFGSTGFQPVAIACRWLVLPLRKMPIKYESPSRYYYRRGVMLPVISWLS